MGVGTIGKLAPLGAAPVKATDAEQIPGLKPGEVFSVAESHYLTGWAGMVQADGVRELFADEVRRIGLELGLPYDTRKCRESLECIVAQYR